MKGCWYKIRPNTLDSWPFIGLYAFAVLVCILVRVGGSA